jgi:hypothetical protein
MHNRVHLSEEESHKSSTFWKKLPLTMISTEAVSSLITVDIFPSINICILGLSHKKLYKNTLKMKSNLYNSYNVLLWTGNYKLFHYSWLKRHIEIFMTFSYKIQSSREHKLIKSNLKVPGCIYDRCMHFILTDRNVYLKFIIHQNLTA